MGTKRLAAVFVGMVGSLGFAQAARGDELAGARDARLLGGATAPPANAALLAITLDEGSRITPPVPDASQRQELARLAPPADSAEGTGGSDEERIGLEIGLGFASAYNDRGYNAYQAERQQDFGFLAAPSIAYSVGETGLSFSYGTVLPLGNGQKELVASGTGAEQDLGVAFERELVEGLSAGVGLTAFLFPFADAAEAGVDTPVYLEPTASLGWSTVLDLGVSLTYSHGMQEELASSFLYVQGTVARSVDVVPETVSLEGSVSYGAKVYAIAQEGRVHDVDVAVSAPIAFGGDVQVAPSAHWSWTDLADQPLSEEHFVWGSLDTTIGL